LRRSANSAPSSTDWPKILMNALTLRAPAMIVTIYGDVVVPRGGILWMGTLIEICALFGISETLVRTAVSRLVNAGHLTGMRDGRRSYYRLADAAHEEFEMAARLLYEPLPESADWLIYHAPGMAEEEARRQHLGALGGDLYLRPNHTHLMPISSVTFRADLMQGKRELAQLAHTLWPLERYALEYRALIARFRPLAERLAVGAAISSADAVFARLLLVHQYRHVLLADPLLPSEVLPYAWPAVEARQLFANLYLALSPEAEKHVSIGFQGRDGLLPAKTAQTDLRDHSLRHQLQGTRS